MERAGLRPPAWDGGYLEGAGDVFGMGDLGARFPLPNLLGEGGRGIRSPEAGQWFVSPSSPVDPETRVEVFCRLVDAWWFGFELK